MFDDDDSLDTGDDGVIQDDLFQDTCREDDPTDPCSIFYHHHHNLHEYEDDDEDE